MTGGDGSLRTWVRGTARASEPTTYLHGEHRGEGRRQGPQGAGSIPLDRAPTFPYEEPRGRTAPAAGTWPVPLQCKCLCGLSEQPLHVPTLCHTHYFRLSFQPLPPQPAQVALVPLHPQFTDLKTEACRGWEACGSADT